MATEKVDMRIPEEDPVLKKARDKDFNPFKRGDGANQTAGIMHLARIGLAQVEICGVKLTGDLEKDLAALPLFILPAGQAAYLKHLFETGYIQSPRGFIEHLLLDAMERDGWRPPPYQKPPEENGKEQG